MPLSTFLNFTPWFNAGRSNSKGFKEMRRTHLSEISNQKSRPFPAGGRARSLPSVKAEAATDQRGRYWVRVKLGDRVGYALLEHLLTEPKKFLNSLATQGVIVADPALQRKIYHQVQVNGRNLRVYALDCTGWHGDIYVRKASDIPRKRKGLAVVNDLPEMRRRWSTDGSFDIWRGEVARLCTDQALPTFALGCAFASLLLPFVPRISDNPGFEFVGKDSKGKSSMARLAVSVFGSGPDWWGNWHTTNNGLEPRMQACADALMILDEENHQLDAKGAGEDVAKAVFMLADGSEKTRLGAGEASKNRFLFLSTANQPVCDLLARTAETRANAVRVRLGTIKVARKFGCFDTLPPGCPDAAAAIVDLNALPSAHYGWAGEAYLERLEQWSRSSRRTLGKRIDRRIDEFKRRAGVDPNDGTASRLADKFALVYAAADLARRWNILPLEFVGDAILDVYLSSIKPLSAAASSKGSAPMTAIECVRVYLKENSENVVDLNDGAIDLSITELDKTPGLLYSGWGENWVLFRKTAFDAAFGHRATGMLNDLKDAGLLRTTDGFQTQIKIRTSSPKDRVYCIRLAREGI